MKTAIFLLSFIVISLFTYSQFPGTDSLRSYNNKYIDNNATKAFTNLRLHNLLAGVIDWVDSARAGESNISLGVDTLWAVNDTTIRYRKNGLFRTFIIRGGVPSLDTVLLKDNRLRADRSINLGGQTFKITLSDNSPFFEVDSIANVVGDGDGNLSGMYMYIDHTNQTIFVGNGSNHLTGLTVDEPNQQVYIMGDIQRPLLKTNTETGEISYSEYGAGTFINNDVDYLLGVNELGNQVEVSKSYLKSAPGSNTNILYNNGGDIAGENGMNFNNVTNSIDLGADDSSSAIHMFQNNSLNDDFISMNVNYNSYKRIFVRNFSAGASAAAGGLFRNNLNHACQFYAASSGNSSVPDGMMLRWTGLGGMNIVVDSSYIRFARFPASTEWARFTALGHLGLNTTTPTTRLYVNGSIGQNKDSVDIVDNIAMEYYLLIDSITGKYKRTYNVTRNLNTQYSAVNNSGTSETDIYTYPVPANIINSDGNKIEVITDGILVDNTATSLLKIYFAGTEILNTTALSIGLANSAYVIKVRVIRTSSTTAHAYVEANTPGLSQTYFLNSTDLTSLNFATTNIIKITATAGGVGGGSNDITGKSWIVDFTK